jgi:hypothetical protein
MIQNIQKHEAHKEQIISRLPEVCRVAIKDRFGSHGPQCLECRQLVLSSASNPGESPAAVADRVRQHMTHQDCPGGSYLRRDAGHKSACTHSSN